MTIDADTPRDQQPAAAPALDCLCLGLGPQLTALLRRVVATDALANQLRTGELEALRFLRALIDQRIAGLSPDEPQGRGTKVTIE